MQSVAYQDYFSHFVLLYTTRVYVGTATQGRLTTTAKLTSMHRDQCSILLDELQIFRLLIK